jgi:hypothetical protein
MDPMLKKMFQTPIWHTGPLFQTKCFEQNFFLASRGKNEQDRTSKQVGDR